MFMAAVARRRFDANKKCTFDGKIEICPFVETEPAKRNSKNRAKGTMVTKPIESVDKEEIRRIMFEKLYPAIRKKWPIDSQNRPIFIQQDNAKPHLSEHDEDVVKEGNRDGFKIQLKPQPANSPDFNVLDLGFFNSIQSLQHEASPTSIDELIDAVEQALADDRPETLDNVFFIVSKGNGELDEGTW